MNKFSHNVYGVFLKQRKKSELKSNFKEKKIFILQCNNFIKLFTFFLIESKCEIKFCLLPKIFKWKICMQLSEEFFYLYTCDMYTYILSSVRRLESTVSFSGVSVGWE